MSDFLRTVKRAQVWLIANSTKRDTLPNGGLTRVFSHILLRRLPLACESILGSMHILRQVRSGLSFNPSK